MDETNQLNSVAVANYRNASFGEVTRGDASAQPTKLLALSHTKLEQRLYELMLAATKKTKTKAVAFSIRDLMIQTQIHNSSSLRRAQIGLVNKLSIERQKSIACDTVNYLVFSPVEILARRRKAGFNARLNEKSSGAAEDSSGRVIERLVEQHNLSRRQAEVALKCAEGLSNAEIGAKLLIRQETVKFHLTNIFIKFGVKRRGELIAYLFRQELTV